MSQQDPPVVLPEPIAEAVDKLKSAADLLETYGAEATKTVCDLIQQAFELLA